MAVSGKDSKPEYIDWARKEIWVVLKPIATAIMPNPRDIPTGTPIASKTAAVINNTAVAMIRSLLLDFRWGLFLRPLNYYSYPDINILNQTDIHQNEQERQEGVYHPFGNIGNRCPYIVGIQPFGKSKESGKDDTVKEQKKKVVNYI
jgi:hypothetical protein